MNVLIIYKFTNLARAPDELFKTLKINNRGYVVYFIYDKFQEILKIINNHPCDNIVVHFNNKFLDHPMLNKPNVKKIIQYHSEPVHTKVMLNTPPDYHKIVLNQYHCTLDEYNDCDYIVRNIFNNTQPVVFSDKIKVGFYPSVLIPENKFYDKGFIETKEVFDCLSNKYPHVNFELKYGMTYEECIKCKRDCHILIDECKTGSFHKTTLEGLSMGCIVIVNINKKLEEKHIELYRKKLPVINSNMNDLKTTLELLLNKRKQELETEALLNKNKFEDYWNKSIISNEYFDIYDKVLGISS